jgi:ribosomal protein S16
MSKKGMFSTAAVLVIACVIMLGYRVLWQGPDGQALPPAASPASLKEDDAKEPLQAPSLAFPGTDGGEVRLPLQIVKSQLTLDDGTRSLITELPEPPMMSYQIPAEMQDKLQAVMVYREDVTGGYLLLAPQGWQASAVVGANGSYGVTLIDPNHPDQTLEYSDTAGSCQGCAINNIGTYFPERAEWADQQGFTVYEPLTFTDWIQAGAAGEDARTAAYTTKATSEGDYSKGILYYQEDSYGYLTRQLEFKLSENEAVTDETMEIVLDFFKIHHGPLIIEDQDREQG